MLSADDLQYFLAVARTGRLVKAAEELKVDHTTVGRRINALERNTGSRLFDRTPSGWLLTPAGQLLLEPAEAVTAAMQSATDALGSGDSRLRGAVRVLTPDGFGSFILAPSLGKLRKAHPDLTIELVTATAQLDHSVRAFDVAVTLGKPNSDRVIVKPLSSYKLRLYASKAYLDGAPPLKSIDDMTDHDLIWYVDKLLDVDRLRQVSTKIPSRVTVQSTNLIAHWQAAANGVGIAPMPQFVAMQDDRLVNVLPEVSFTARFWLVLPKEHARLARVRAVTQHIEDIVTERAEDLRGEPAGYLM